MLVKKVSIALVGIFALNIVVQILHSGIIDWFFIPHLTRGPSVCFPRNRVRPWTRFLSAVDPEVAESCRTSLMVGGFDQSGVVDLHIYYQTGYAMNSCHAAWKQCNE